MRGRSYLSRRAAVDCRKQGEPFRVRNDQNWRYTTMGRATMNRIKTYKSQNNSSTRRHFCQYKIICANTIGSFSDLGGLGLDRTTWSECKCVVDVGHADGR